MKKNLPLLTLLSFFLLPAFTQSFYSGIDYIGTLLVNAKKSGVGDTTIPGLNGKSAYLNAISFSAGSMVLPVNQSNIAACPYILTIHPDDEINVKRISKR